MLPRASFRAAASSSRARCLATVPFTSAVRFSFCCCICVMLRGKKQQRQGKRAESAPKVKVMTKILTDNLHRYAHSVSYIGIGLCYADIDTAQRGGEDCAACLKRVNNLASCEEIVTEFIRGVRWCVSAPFLSPAQVELALNVFI